MVLLQLILVCLVAYARCDLGPSVALKKPTGQTSTGWAGASSRAVDGNDSGQYFKGASCSHTLGHRSPWWYVDLGKYTKITGVSITTREDCCSERLNDFYVAVVKVKPDNDHLDFTSGQICAYRGADFKGTLGLKCRQPVGGRYVLIRMRDQGTNRFLTLCEVGVYTGTIPHAGKPEYPAYQNDIGWIGYAWRALDGNRDQHYFHRSCTHTLAHRSPYWYVDFHKRKTIKAVRITNRADCCTERLNDFEIAVSHEHPPKPFHSSKICAYVGQFWQGSKGFKCRRALAGRYLAIMMRDQGVKRYLTLCEVEYFDHVPNGFVGGDRYAYQISTGWSGHAYRAVDTIVDGNYWHHSCSHTVAHNKPWWYADIGATKTIRAVSITNRADCCSERLNDFDIAAFTKVPTAEQLGGNFNEGRRCKYVKDTFKGTKRFQCNKPRTGRYVAVIMRDQGKARFLTLCEVVPDY